MTDGWKRSKAEERMIRRMTRRGGKGFRILRSAETRLKKHVRVNPPSSFDQRQGPVLWRLRKLTSREKRMRALYAEKYGRVLDVYEAPPGTPPSAGDGLRFPPGLGRGGGES